MSARLAAPASAADGDGTLVLVHGYCSSDNPFAATPDAWSGRVETFLDRQASRGNAQFAALIDEFVTAAGVGDWAGVGHSQGGIALTHLLCTYWSGLDGTRLRDAAGATGRSGNGTRAGPPPALVQSVGTPYQGCSGAGTGASLISLFGYGCGANADLTPSGATTWLAATVSEQCAQHVYYYTTKGRSSNSCSWATNLVLYSPNDGTTELRYADLPGGNNMGTTGRQCHTTDMNYPPQTADAARNARLNADAARSGVSKRPPTVSINSRRLKMF